MDMQEQKRKSSNNSFFVGLLLGVMITLTLVGIVVLGVLLFNLLTKDSKSPENSISNVAE